MVLEARVNRYAVARGLEAGSIYVDWHTPLVGMLTVSIISTHGGWCYRWSHAGDDKRGFLVGLDCSYACKKFVRGEAEVFDLEATCKAAKRKILERRREGDLSAMEARDEWEFIQCVECGVESFEIWVNNSELQAPWDCYRTKPGPVSQDFCRFFEVLWPDFVRQLKEEVGE